MTESNTNPETPPVLNEQAVQAIASKTVEEILASKDSKLAITERITSLCQEANTARAEASKTQTELLEIRARHADAAGQVEALTGRLAEANKQVEALKAEQAAADQKVADLTKANTDLGRKVCDAAAEKTVASRTQALAALGEKFATKERIDQAIARNQDGSFVVGDAEFDRLVASLKALAETLKPVQGAGRETPAPPAPAAPDMSAGAEAARAAASIAAASAAKKPEELCKTFATHFGV